MGGTWMLDYGAGNVRSLLNAVRKLGHEIRVIEKPEDIMHADCLIFPGVGAFGAAMDRLKSRGYVEPLMSYLASGKPFMGICVGMQCLFASSEESPGVSGLGIISRGIRRFNSAKKAVPHMGWNGAAVSALREDGSSDSSLLNHDNAVDGSRYYFVHSFAAIVGGGPNDIILDGWAYSLTTYGDETFVSSVRRGNIFATQFHPEKSGWAGLKVLKSFLENFTADQQRTLTATTAVQRPPDKLSRRIIACLDVRANDAGDLVVTKGDQYDVREKDGAGDVRNLGRPVDLARRYFDEGADEITFLNITSFKNCPLNDLPMLEVLRRTSTEVFVPLTIGGGIRDVEIEGGDIVPALDVVSEYFRSGADKVSIGSDAVYAAEEYHKSGGVMTGVTTIERIAAVYGSQAVVVSVDPRRVYVASPAEASNHHVIKTAFPGPNGEDWVWYQCTVKGGREGRDLDVRQLVIACQALGAGEILCNCMDKDGTNSGFDMELLIDVKAAVSIPVIASSGAGNARHFSEVFKAAGVEAALAAGIFHRREVPILDVKKHLEAEGYSVRLTL